MSVQRDLEVMRTFFGDRLLLRSLNDAVAVLPNKPDLGRVRRVPPARACAHEGRPHDADGAADADQRHRDRDSTPEPRAASSSPKCEATAGPHRRRPTDRRPCRGPAQARSGEPGRSGSTPPAASRSPTGSSTETLRSRASWRYSLSDEGLVALLCMGFVDASGQRTTTGAAHPRGARPARDPLRHPHRHRPRRTSTRPTPERAPRRTWPPSPSG